MSEANKIPTLRFSEFSGEWNNQIISDIANKITDGTHDTPKAISKGVPYITAIHVRDGNINFDNCYYLPQEEHDSIYKRCDPSFGDLLMVNIGAGTATSAIVNVEFEFSLKNVALIKPNRKLIDPFFFSQIQRRNGARLKHQISSGRAQPFLSLKAIGKLKLIAPQTLPEQQKIATFLTAVDTKIEQLTKKLTLLEQYKKGVMQKIFSQEIRFKKPDGSDYPDWEEKKLGEVLDYVQPTKYLVSSTEYDDSFATPVLTAGKTFILGYTDETENIFNENLPVIIFDDFTTASKFVNFPFKAKSSAMKILLAKPNENIKFIYEVIQMIKYEIGGHGRHWISQYSTMQIEFPCLEEQTHIANFLSAIDDKIELVSTQLENTQQFKKGLLQQMFV